MRGFRQENSRLIWEQNHETLQIEAWSHDSLRVRSTINATLSEDLPNVLLPPAHTDAEIIIGNDEAIIRNGTITAHISQQGLIHFSQSSNGEELLAEVAPRHSTRIPAR